MSEKIRILEELSMQHPEYAEKLNEIISTLQNPLSAYCEEEAAYRFNELTSLELDKESICEEIAKTQLDQNERWINGETVEVIAKQVLDKVRFAGVLQEGQDFQMSEICSCDTKLSICENVCQKYYDCNNVAIANDILAEYDDV